MLGGAVLLFAAVVRLAAEPDSAPLGWIRVEALVVLSGFLAWFMLGIPSARWAVITELLLWIALAVPCLVLWILSNPPPTPPAETYTPQSKQPAATQRSRTLRAKYASKTRRS
jgi:hypothetical protein